MKRWRWDQGRLEYFKVENIMAIASVLASLDGLVLGCDVDLLRVELEQRLPLPFAPSHYRVWRNYARVFKCAMLATAVNGRLVTTDLCQKLANKSEPVSPDEYLNFVFSHFSYPFPAFAEYSAAENQIFPFIAILKFAFARREAGVSLEEVFSYVVGNECSGLEDLAYYQNLSPTARIPIGDEERQVREMLAFMGQSSFLKWFDKRLYVDTDDYELVTQAVVPFIRVKRGVTPQEEFLALATIGTDFSTHKLDVVLPEREVPQFSVREGGRVFSGHRKLERSPLVRKKFFELHPKIVCDACSMQPRVRYPWTDNILELHHILPLSATLNVSGTTTTMDDLVPLCPSCHKSIHVFYKVKLTEWGVEDFGSKAMAKDIYELAKRGIVQ